MKIKHVAVLTAAFFSIASTHTLAQEPQDASSTLFGVAFGADVATTQGVLDEACRKTDSHASRSATLPIARSGETQLICFGYSGDGIEFDEAAFIFGDDSLSMVEIYGGANAAFESLPGDVFSYSGFSVKREALALSHQELDRLLLMTPSSVRAHMHYWKSPYLKANKGAPTSFPTSAAQPEIIRFGERIETLQPEFKQDCSFLAEQHIEEPWLATEPEVQIQLNCFGYVYAGFPRKIEAVFGDGVLEQVWILTAEAEETRIREALTAEYGPAELVSDTWEVFNDGTVALRKDLPEVLLVSKRVAPAFRPEFEGANAE